MIFARTWRALPSLVNCLATAIPNVLRKTTVPSAGVAISNRVAKPSQDNPVLLCQASGTYTGIRSMPRDRASHARLILVIDTSDISAGLSNLFQICLGGYRLNPSGLVVRSLVARFSHVAGYLVLSWN